MGKDLKEKCNDADDTNDASLVLGALRRGNGGIGLSDGRGGWGRLWRVLWVRTRRRRALKCM